MIMVFEFMGYLNHADLLLPHVYIHGYICFKKTALLFNVHLSCLVNFFLCPADKYMFKVNKLVFGNYGSSIYFQNDQFRKNYLFLTLMSCSVNKVLHRANNPSF